MPYMMCAVRGCKNVSPTPGIAFHKFPSDDSRFSDWERAAGCKLDRSKKLHAVCCVHFDSTAYRLQDVMLNYPINKRRLLPTAIPTVNVPVLIVPPPPSNTPQPILEEKKEPITSTRDNEQEETTVECAPAPTQDIFFVQCSGVPDVMSLCRLCKKPFTEEETPPVNIFREFKSNKSCAEQLKSMFQLKLNNSPDWPSHACFQCTAFIRSMTSFKQRIVATHEELFEIISEAKMNEDDDDTGPDHDELSDIQYNPKEEIIVELPTSIANNDECIIEEVVPEEKILKRVAEEPPKPPAPVKLKKVVISPEEKEFLETEMNKMGLLNCPSCETEPLPTLSDLFYHMQDDHEAMGYVDCCETTLTQRAEIYDHIRLHLDEDYFKCADCEFRAESRAQLKWHARKQHNHWEHKCKTCGKGCESALKLSIHEQYHLSDPDQRSHKCSYCQKAFVAVTPLKIHIERVHEKKDRFICEICGKAMSNRTTLWNHVAEHKRNQSEKKTTQCTVCGKAVRNIRQHLVLAHNMKLIGGKLVCTEMGQCSECGKTMPRLLLNTHRLHHKKWKCTICGKEVSLMHKAVHLRVHAGHMVECQLCRATFSETNRHRHLRTQHPAEYAKLPPAQGRNKLDKFFRKVFNNK